MKGDALVPKGTMGSAVKMKPTGLTQCSHLLYPIIAQEIWFAILTNRHLDQ